MKMEANNIKTLIGQAAHFLRDKGYSVRETSLPKGIDLIALEKASNKAIFVAVMDGDTVRSIPLKGLGTSKKSIARSYALLKGASKWVKAAGWEGDIQFDAVWISTETIPIGLSHICNIGIRI